MYIARLYTLWLTPVMKYLWLRTRIATRRASTSAFPYPSNSHPTPHQIFHLSAGASQEEIKQRYYDLVRAHHPDSPQCRDIPPAERHARFQSITAAYEALRGKRPIIDADPYRAEVERRRRAQQAWRAERHRAEFAGAGPFGGYDYPGTRKAWNASADDRWKDWVIICIGIISLGVGLGPALIWPAQRLSEKTHQAASANLAQARQEAREFGKERRHEIRRRVKENQENSTGPECGLDHGDYRR